MPRPEATAVCEPYRIDKHRNNQPIELLDNQLQEQENRDDKRRRQTMAFRKMLATRRGADPNEPQQRQIRFDYSDIRLENENLDIELELRETSLHREKFMKNVNREQNFKKAKKDAEVMLQLKNAVNRRKPNTSFERVVKSANIRKESRITVPKEKEKPTLPSAKVDRKENVKLDNKDNVKEDSKDNETSVDSVESQQIECDSDSDSSVESEPEDKPTTKPFNNLTMFLLSLQTFKSSIHRQRDITFDNRDKIDENDKLNPKKFEDSSGFAQRAKSAYPRAKSAMPGSRSAKQGPKSALPRARSALQAEVCEKYGIHVQKDLSRSRRTLGEISKLEHDTKFKHVDKFEDRRMKLLAACKDTESIDRRIGHFLKEIDDFKKISRPDNSLERVLMRSKSAYGLLRHKTELPDIGIM